MVAARHILTVLGTLILNRPQTLSIPVNPIAQTFAMAAPGSYVNGEALATSRIASWEYLTTLSLRHRCQRACAV